VDTIQILKEEGADRIGGVMHCFTESLDVAKAAMDMGFYISFSGIVTFKSAKDLQETCLKVPLERMLIETDSPYLAPIPYRGKTNEPAWVAKVGEFIANLKGLPLDELANATSQNFYDCFQLDRASS
jgi:TatD DNase family protein